MNDLYISAKITFYNWDFSLIWEMKPNWTDIWGLTWVLSCVVCWGPCDRAQCEAGSPHSHPHLGHPGDPWYDHCVWVSHFPVHLHKPHRCPPASRTPSGDWGYSPKRGPGWGAEQAGKQPRKETGAWWSRQSSARMSSLDRSPWRAVQVTAKSWLQ